MPEIVVADTSCLIILSKIHRLELLKNLYSKIFITKEIQDEFGQLLPDWIIIESVKDDKIKRILKLDIDLGEASAIALCLERESSTLLIDEKRGRKMARELGITNLKSLANNYSFANDHSCK